MQMRVGVWFPPTKYWQMEAPSVNQKPIGQRGIGRAALLCVFLLVALIATARSSPAQPTPKRISIPITFVANAGQFPKPYAFEVNDEGFQAMLLRQGADLYLPVAKGRSRRLEFRLVGESGKGIISGLDQAPGVSNYFLGDNPSRWVRGAPQYGKVEIRAVYKGVNLVFHVSGRRLEQNFDLAPFADPSSIAFRLTGANSLTLSSHGNLILRVGHTTFTLEKPRAFQGFGTKRKVVAAKYRISPDNTVHFDLGKYNHAQPLVIDPVLVFSTYLGGSGVSSVSAVTTDTNGNVYVVGTTNSTNFPTVNPEQPTCVSCTAYPQEPDVFVSELDPTGHTLLFSTYLGGSGADSGGSIAIGPDGSIIVSGLSASPDFPLAGQGTSLSCPINNKCFFLASFKPGGATLNFSGIYGGADGVPQDIPDQSANISQAIIAVDAQGNVYLSGDSWESSFQFTSGVLDSTPPGYPYAFLFVMKVSSTGQVIYSTAIPNNSSSVSYAFQPAGMVVDTSGQVTVAGTAPLGLLTTSGALDPTFQSSAQVQGFVLQLNANATALNFATYVPGVDYVEGFTVDSSGNLVLAGTTQETTLPVSTNAYQKTLAQGSPPTCESGYVLELDPKAQSVLGATYLSRVPAQGVTNLLGIGVDAHSNIYVDGITGPGNPFSGGITAPSSFPLKNPIISQQYVTNFQGGPIVAEFSPDLSTLDFSTYINGFDNTGLGGAQLGNIAVDPQGNVIVAGSTMASYYPTTPGSIQQNLSPTSGADTRAGFITKVDAATPAGSPCFSPDSLNFVGPPSSSGQTTGVQAQTTETIILPITNCGNAPLTLSNISTNTTSFAAINLCGSIAPGDTCQFPIEFTPLTDETDHTALTFLDDAGVTYKVWLSGSGVAGVIQPTPAVVDFGSVLAGGGTNLAEVHFLNFGNGPLTFYSTTLHGAGFSLGASTCVSLTGGGQCFITVEFSPASAGSFQGTLEIDSNDPIHPTLNIPLSGVGVTANPVPVVSSISPLTAQTGGQSFTLQVSGLGFSPASVVDLNGQPLATSYTDYTTLSATVPSSSLSNAAELPVTVVNPAPGGGTSNSFPLNVYQLLPIPAVALASMPGSNTIYAAVPEQSSVDPNTVIPINAETGAMGTPIPVGANPQLLALSSDGNYLFVAAQGAQTIQRINLQTDAVDETFPYPTPSAGQVASATDMHGVPGSPQSVVVAFSYPAELALYDSSGLVNSVSVYMSTFTFLNGPGTIYGLPFTNQSNYFPIVTLDSQSLHYTPSTTLLTGPSATGSALQSDGSLLYTSSGQIWDPASESLVGNFNSTITNLISAGTVSVRVDPSADRTFMLGLQPYEGYPGTASFDALTLSSYNNTTQQLAGMIPFVSVDWPTAASLSQWGSDGFAFIAAAPGATNSVIYLLHSSMATTPELGRVSLSPGLTFGNVNVGSPGVSKNITLTDTGTGPLVINGIFVVGTEDYSQTNNCGNSVPAGASCTVTVTFTPTAAGTDKAAIEFVTSDTEHVREDSLAGNGVVSLSTAVAPSSLSFPPQQAGTTSSPQTVTLSNTGTGAATFTYAEITGPDAADFHVSDSCSPVIQVGENCPIAVTFSPVASGPNSASLVISDNSTSSPHTVALSGPGSDFAVSSPSTGVTVTAGQSANFQIALTTTGGPTANSVTFSASGNPADTTVTFAPATYPSGTTSGISTMTVATTASAAMPPAGPGTTPSILLLLPLLGLLALLIDSLAFRRPHASRKWRYLLAAQVVFFILLAASCGGGGGGGSVGSGGTGGTGTPQGTPAGTYTITVTGTSGSVSRSTSVKLTVN